MKIDIHFPDKIHNVGIQAIGNSEEISNFNRWMWENMKKFYANKFFHQGDNEDWSFFEIFDEIDVEKIFSILEKCSKDLNAEIGEI